jgi:hypothetical protein
VPKAGVGAVRDEEGIVVLAAEGLLELHRRRETR